MIVSVVTGQSLVLTAKCVPMYAMILHTAVDEEEQNDNKKRKEEEEEGDDNSSRCGGESW